MEETRVVVAAMAMPGHCRTRISVNGNWYVDSGADPFPIRDLYRCFRPSEIVIATNCTRGTWERWAPSKVERAFLPLFLRGYPRRFRLAMKRRGTAFHRGRAYLEMLACGGVRTAVLFSRVDTPAFTRDVVAFKNAYAYSTADALSFFQHA